MPVGVRAFSTFLKRGVYECSDLYFNDQLELVARYPALNFTYRDWITYPDDPESGYAAQRAWDRHLVSVGLLPVFTSDLEKVGPILLGPHAKGKQYIVYGYNKLGHLTSWRETVQKANVQEASDPTGGRGS